MPPRIRGGSRSPPSRSATSPCRSRWCARWRARRRRGGVGMGAVAWGGGRGRGRGREAEAERERRSRIILAEGEAQAAQRMLEAAQIYEGSAGAMHLRELQNLEEIARERNLIIVTPRQMASAGETASIAAAIARKSTP